MRHTFLERKQQPGVYGLKLVVFIQVWPCDFVDLLCHIVFLVSNSNKNKQEPHQYETTTMRFLCELTAINGSKGRWNSNIITSPCKKLILNQIGQWTTFKNSSLLSRIHIDKSYAVQLRRIFKTNQVVWHSRSLPLHGSSLFILSWSKLMCYCPQTASISSPIHVAL